MRFQTGTATSSGKIKDDTDNVKVIGWRARAGNPGDVVVGDSDISANNGIELGPGEKEEWNFTKASEEGSVKANTLYVSLESPNKVDWIVIKE
jgi:hypothetical protein